ncbi:MAG: aspartate carbamoyltransferase catalytic subunit [Candidatus Eisenbacteria bacterium]|nr:aspartate carbamoyltransferase catalytic subunit [Candidatus Eisenbacteria bacterium]
MSRATTPPRERRHLLGLEGMSREEILAILDAAECCRARLRAGGMPFDDLRGVTVLLAFFEDSTRTRVSFELAARHLGATVATLTTAGSSISKGESLFDTVQNIGAMGVDLVVVRHSASGAPAFLARQLDVGVINAGDGRHEHPTQGLLDLMTLRDAWKNRFAGRRLALVGDVAHSRVARSAIFGLTALGASVTVAGPATLIPAGLERLGCAVAPTVEEAMEGADAVMALRLQKERMDGGLLPSLGEFSKVWGLTVERVRLLARDAVVLHPGPMNRGVEVMPEVADGERSVILDQVENGVALRCAVLERCAEAARRAPPAPVAGAGLGAPGGTGAAHAKETV